MSTNEVSDDNDLFPSSKYDLARVCEKSLIVRYQIGHLAKTIL